MLRNELKDASEQLARECKAELTTHIIPFWNNMRDPRGGFYGQMDAELVLHPDAPKGVILHARILWFYSSCYLALRDPILLEHAKHAYAFLRDFCYDKEHGGMFWSVNCNGSPAEDMKHTYNQAFCIYGLCAFYQAAGEQSALELALQLFETIEAKTKDAYGYVEAFSRNWEPVANEFLSENGLQAEKTMNTVLHLIEAYTELYRVTESERVAERLTWLLTLIADKIYDSARHALRVFFDAQWNEIGDVYSYGHDIEASWLLDRACEVLGDPALLQQFSEIDLAIAETIQAVAVQNQALNNECVGGEVNTLRIWWVQAEGVVGFLNAYLHSNQETFHQTALQLWQYIKTTQIDRRVDGEWHAEVTADGNPRTAFDMAGPWKCPYHNGRMCLEVMKRISAVC